MKRRIKIKRLNITNKIVFGGEGTEDCPYMANFDLRNVKMTIELDDPAFRFVTVDTKLTPEKFMKVLKKDIEDQINRTMTKLGRR